MFTDNRCNLQRISIHALRVEGDKSPWALRTVFGISIHALRVEGDLYHMPPTN